MNILITGGAGFIGSHTADALLARGASVRILDCLDPQIHPAGEFPGYMAPAAELVRGDVRDRATVEAALRGVDVVYHFAAHTGVGQSMYAAREYVDANCTGTATLLEALLAARGRVTRLILASSRAAYGEGAGACEVHGIVSPGPRSAERLAAGEFAPVCPVCGEPVSSRPTPESLPPHPVSIYGWTKLAQEQLCRHAASLLGIDAVLLRYFNVIGPRQSLANPYTGIAALFYGRIVNDRPVLLYERGAPVRDFVSIDDVVAANLLALEAKLPARSVEVNVGSGRATTIRAFAGEIARACGRAAAALEETSRYRVGDVHACVADPGRARAVLAYRPAVDLAAGIRAFVAWARAQGASDDVSERADRELERHGLLRGARAEPA